MLLGLGVCWIRPQAWGMRLLVAACALLLMAPEYAFGKVEHVNHLFLVAHVWAIFVPWLPYHVADPNLRPRATAIRLYQAAVLLIYTMAGLWKVFDLTVRAALKPGLTWLDPGAAFQAALVIAAREGRSVDALVAAQPLFALFPIGYILLMLVFVPASLSPWRRPYLLLLLPVVASFHILNGVLGLAHFYSTIVVLLGLFAPYDRFAASVLASQGATAREWSGARSTALYLRRYANGDADRFAGFYAYRARAEDRAWWRATLLYHPLVEGAARLLLRFNVPK